MKIGLYSDLHFEVDPFEFPATHTGDVLILSGDIIPIDLLTRSEDSPYHQLAHGVFKSFLKSCSERFRDVIYIPGNHEYYHGNIRTSAGILKDFLAEFSNIHLLDNRSVVIGGVKFIGSTLWFDANGKNPISTQYIQNGMNDFRLIQTTGYRKYSAIEAIQIFDRNVQYIKSELESSEGPVVVCTHHAPSPQSINQKYKHDFHINGGYSSNLEDLILQNPKIRLWTHGHTHCSMDYMVGDTRIVCNPKGYNNENPAFRPMILIDLPC